MCSKYFNIIYRSPEPEVQSPKPEFVTHLSGSRQPAPGSQYTPDPFQRVSSE